MEIKRSLKILFILVILIVFSSSFYIFNKWFFNKFDVGKDNNINSNLNGKEVIKDVVVPEEYNKEVMKPIEKYYCEKNYKLVEKECILNIEAKSIEQVKVDNLVKETFKRSELYNIVYLETGVDINGLTEDERKVINDEIYKTATSACAEDKGTLEQKDTPTDLEYICTYKQEGNQETNITCLDNSYTLEDNKCKKTIKVSAKIGLECKEGYSLVDNKCLINRE